MKTYSQWLVDWANTQYKQQTMKRVNSFQREIRRRFGTPKGVTAGFKGLDEMIRRKGQTP